MTNLQKVQTATQTKRFAATDTCVQCGLCLPHCPTYLMTYQESDSPRGRISLIQAMARGELAADESLVGHLETCLVCRACEDMCPSRVPYENLINAARAELVQRNALIEKPLESWLLDRFTHSRGLRQFLYMGLSLWQATIPQQQPRTVPPVPRKKARRLHDLLPPMQKTPLIAFDNPPPQENDLPANSKQVQLFTGCAGEVFDRETLTSCKKVLSYLSYRVYTPKDQTCCGALHLHAGDESSAKTLCQTNLNSFRDDLPILTSASGCGAVLRDAVNWYGENARGITSATEDICAFVQKAEWPDKSLKPLASKVAIHTPCSLKRVFHDDDSVTALLSRIPDIDLREVVHNDRCCGGAGRYMIDHPQMTDALVSSKIQDLAENVPEILVSTNIGCALHIQSALRSAGLTIEVIHPLTLIARQLSELAVPKTLA